MSQVVPSNPTVAAPTAPLWLPVFSTAFVVFNLITSEFLPVSLLTPIAQDLGISEGAAGQMISATSIAAVFTSLLTAAVTRTLDRKVVLLIASAALVLSNVLVALSPNLFVIMLARLLLGLAMGGFWSLSNATALRLVPRSFLPRALAIISGGVAIANVVAAPLGSVLGAALGWRGVFVIAALLGLVGLVWQWISLPRMAPGRPAELKTLVHLLGRRQVQVGMAALLLTFGGFMTFFAYLRPFLEQVTADRGGADFRRSAGPGGGGPDWHGPVQPPADLEPAPHAYSGAAADGRANSGPAVCRPRPLLDNHPADAVGPGEQHHARRLGQLGGSRGAR